MKQTWTYVFFQINYNSITGWERSRRCEVVGQRLARGQAVQNTTAHQRLARLTLILPTTETVELRKILVTLKYPEAFRGTES